ncbi:MAG TPA: NAD-dependent epimerase/dehydratase family protein [Methylovirgula sp.]|nr:NAD-dependent epimerase/dehydratase family protein [Methylovirgula sp.]
MIFVTGAAGFIGSNLVDRLLSDGEQVVGYDDFSTGMAEFVAPARNHKNFSLIEGDLLDTGKLTQAMRGARRVFHFAANADVRFGLEHPRKDLEQNTIATFNVLEAMRANDIKEIAFASTGSIYGEARLVPTPEDAPFPIQTSLYGASKLAGEGLIAAYVEGFGFKARIYRFVSILGERYSHGHIFDFMLQLSKHPEKLHVLGDGKQRKSYLYVGDCIEAVLLGFAASDAPIEIFNLGTDEICQVLDSIGWIAGRLKLSPQLTFSGGERGWIGDNPLIFLATDRIRALGWRPKQSIRQAVELTVDWLDANRWVFEKRK